MGVLTAGKGTNVNHFDRLEELITAQNERIAKLEARVAALEARRWPWSKPAADAPAPAAPEEDPQSPAA